MLTKKIVILGASVVGTALLAREKGYTVFVLDNGNIKERYKDVLLKNEIIFEEGKHTQLLKIEADEVIKSPGIPDKSKIVQLLKKRSITIIDELGFASMYTNAKKICITGSNGKTTTTLLTYHILKNVGFKVGLTDGNIGKSFASQVAKNDYDYYGILFSGFQLNYMTNFKADFPILCNITPDHLDRYNYEINNYIDSKFKILNNQTDESSSVYCADDSIIINEISKRNIKSHFLKYL